MDVKIRNPDRNYNGTLSLVNEAFIKASNGDFEGSKYLMAVEPFFETDAEELQQSTYVVTVSRETDIFNATNLVPRSKIDSGMSVINMKISKMGDYLLLYQEKLRTQRAVLQRYSFTGWCSMESSYSLYLMRTPYTLHRV